MCDFQEAFLNFAFWFVVLTIIGAFVAARWFMFVRNVKESKLFFKIKRKHYLIKILQVHHNKASPSLGSPTVRFASGNMWLNTTTEKINFTCILFPLIWCQLWKARVILKVLCIFLFFLFSVWNFKSSIVDRAFVLGR